MDCRFRDQRPQHYVSEATLGMIRAFLRRPPSREAPQPSETLPELEPLVRRRTRTHPGVSADLAHFGDRAESVGVPFAVERCEVDSPGRVWLSLLQPERPAEVRQGDVFFDGALYSADLDTGHVRVACRLLRLVCRNGAVLPAHGALGTEVYERFPDGSAQGDLERVLEAGFSGQVLERTTDLLRRTTLVPAESMSHALAWVRLSRRVRLPARTDEAFAEEREPTLYGAWNAVTRVARDAPTLHERESLERLGGEMVSRFFGVATGVSQPV